MRSTTKKKKRLKVWRPSLNPWTWGLCYFVVIGFAHCSEFDPNEKGLSGFGQLTTRLEAPFARRSLHVPEAVPHLSAQRTIEKLKRVTGEPTPTPEAAPAASVVAGSGPVVGEADQPAADPGAGWGVRKVLYTLIDGVGLRQNWRLFQLPHPEVLGYEVKSYNRELSSETPVYVPAFTRCLELDNRGQCEPSIGSRLEFEMLREMERRRSPMIFESFSEHWTQKAGRPMSDVFRRYEFVVYRHAFKTSKDFSKRGNAQVLYSKDL